MNQNEIFERTQTVLMDCLGLNANEIQMESHIKNDLGCDSIGMADLIMQLENEFKVIINDNELNGIETVKDTVECIQMKLN